MVARLGSFFTRFFHRIIYLARALSLFVDDCLFIWRMDIFANYSSSGLACSASFSLLISWRKAELHREVNWIGWTFNFSTDSMKSMKLQQSERDILKLINELLASKNVQEDDWTFLWALLCGWPKLFLSWEHFCITSMQTFTEPALHIRSTQVFGSLPFLV